MKVGKPTFILVCLNLQGSSGFHMKTATAVFIPVFLYHGRLISGSYETGFEPFSNPYFCAVTGLLAVPYRKSLLTNVFTGTFYCKTRAKFSSTLG
jgi:hypothetical protein